MERNIKSIIGCGVFTFDSNVGRYGFRQTEKNQRVIDQVWRDVEQNSAARARGLSPCSGLELRAITVVRRFETDDVPQRPGLDNLPDSLEITVKAAVVIDG